MSFRVDTKLLQYIPKSKQAAVKAIWKDSDGYWVGLQDPWYATLSGIPASWIHTESIAEVNYSGAKPPELVKTSSSCLL